MSKETIILVIVLVSTSWMTGLIWLVQMVHYPMFDAYDAKTFVKSMKRHQQNISMVVLPAMMVELLGSIWLWWQIGTWPHYVLMTLLVIIWWATFFLQVPCHNQLSLQWDQSAYHRLVRSNWVRTVAWSLRSFLLVWLLLIATA